MPATHYQQELDHALYLADEADRISMRHFRDSSLKVQTKPDNTPVTQADLEVEERLSSIATMWHEGYLGEEGARAHNSTRLWVVDPIDATKNFLRGLPIWGSLIALNDNSETIVAAVSCPALGRRWWAAKGSGAWTRDVDGSIRQIHVSNVQRIADAFFLVSTPLTAWNSVPTGQIAVEKLLDSAWRWRAPGDMLGYMWLAEGAADASFEPLVMQWDIEAPKLILTEAGGAVWTSADVSAPADQVRSCVASNGHLQAALLKALNL